MPPNYRAMATFFTTLPKTLTLTLVSGSLSKPNPKKASSMQGQKPTSRKPRKASYGASRKSILKKSFNQEQVMFTAPLSDDPAVAIIGGGMAGLSCALYLEKRGVRSTVFDTVGQFIFFLLNFFHWCTIRLLTFGNGWVSSVFWKAYLLRRVYS